MANSDAPEKSGANNTNLPVASESTQQQEENTQTLQTLADAAGLVQRYATKLLGKDRAAEFATHLSIMAQKDDRFKSAKPESVVTTMMACVNLDLMPNTPRQFAHLIPYESPRGSGRYDIQFQPGYKGLVELAYRTGHVGKVDAELVFPEDVFEVSLGTDRQLTHKLTAASLDRDRTKVQDVVCAYATALLDTGEKVFYVLSKSEIEKVKRESVKAVKDDSPWKKWEEEQIKKTAVKRLTKLLPTSDKDNRLQLATQLDSLVEAGKKLRFKDGEILEGETVEDAASSRRARMAAADAKYKQLNQGGHTPKAVKGADNE